MTFIVAEVGSNWSSLDGCKQSIQMAKVCGADAVKFQLYSHKELYGLDGPKLPGELPRDWIPILANKADGAGIEFMCTAFSPEGVEFLNEYVYRHKIASSNLTDPLLLKAVNKSKKPVMLSTGASSVGDIATALTYLRDCPVTLMYCVSAYPSTEHNLFAINFMRINFQNEEHPNVVGIGFSDHSLDKVYAPLSAVVHFKADAIEKHVNFVHVESGPDVPHSLSAGDFKEMVEHIRGNRHDFPLMRKEESGFLTRNNVRCLAIAPIAKGQELRLNENFGVYRSKSDDLSGVVGFAAESLIGKVAKHDIPAGKGISGADLG